ncbi:alpha/beta fold hydrolase [Streptomyces sp. SL13]|uniref:Alpha/beta fold hydrolase n=1 Tax=Streptantibioticus silvisoli TaxID=2705255 RepID=A0AA90K969_9ACTN|nr:alpha/beta fold hydrolase [Streptantibioticus silvisoli]MDI5970497.1 alpha/beta fold hydrolase [Streptantibioticus silvisoli]
MTTVSPEHAPARPALTVNHLPTAVKAAVLLLHGGRSESLEPPSPWSPPAARMIPFGRSVLRATEGRGVALATARYRFRGWNGDRADTARDTRWALDALAERTGGVPVVLVGHSMGGRAALWAAGHPSVTGVVALAPWCPLEDPVEQLDGRRSVLLHCPTDRVTDARGSWELVHRARARSAAACGIVMPRGGHTMLRGATDWHRLTTALVTGLLGLAPLPSEVEAALAPAAPVSSARMTYARVIGGG